MNILFMGTPEIAAQSLQALMDAGHRICGVFTRADKPVGRAQTLTPPPVKVLAQKYNIPVFQPARLKEEEAQTIRTLAPDLIAVVAYGRILPPVVLEIPPLGCVNLHVSLLPKYRGAAPVQWAVINGEKVTGVTVMYMDEGLDTGDIITQTEIPIGENETAGKLMERVAEIGAKQLVETLSRIEQGKAPRMPQKGEEATLAPVLKKEMGEFDFSRSAAELHNLVRGLSPWPSAYFFADGKKVKVLESRYIPEMQGGKGEVLSTDPLTIATPRGALALLQLVPEGSRPMSGTAFAAGKRWKTGSFLQK